MLLKFVVYELSNFWQFVFEPINLLQPISNTWIGKSMPLAFNLRLD